MNKLKDSRRLKSVPPRLDKLVLTFNRFKERFKGLENQWLGEFKGIEEVLKLGSYKEQGESAKREIRNYEDFIRIEIQIDKISIKFQGTYFLLNYHKEDLKDELIKSIESLEAFLEVDSNVSQVDIACDYIDTLIEDLIHFDFHSGVYFQFLNRAKKRPLYRYLQVGSAGKEDGKCAEMLITTSNYEIYFYRKDSTIKNKTESDVKIEAYKDLYRIKNFFNRPITRFETRLKYVYAMTFQILLKNEGELSLEQILKLTLSEFYSNKDIRLRGECDDKKKSRWKPCKFFRILTFRDIGFHFNHISPQLTKYEVIKEKSLAQPSRAATSFLRSSGKENLDIVETLEILFDKYITQENLKENGGLTREDLYNISQKILKSKLPTSKIKEIQDAIEERANRNN